MAQLTTLVAQLRETLVELIRLSPAALSLEQRGRAVVAVGLLLLVSTVALLRRHLRSHTPGRTRIALPALRPATWRSPIAPARHAAFALFLVGLPPFVLALADPQTRLVREEASYPGHRIAILIDASMSMNTAFATERLRSGNAFLANVAAAEYFVRRRMEGPYRDLVALVQFGSEAYVVTPFTNDYENVLLSIGLIGTPDEYRRFPDHGTIIVKAISQGVRLFRTFDFLQATGNLIVIFSDGEDTRATHEGFSLDEVLREAAQNHVPVYFIRTSYDRQLGEVLPDHLWKQAVEKTGGRFYPAANEEMILQAIHEIDDLAKGRIQITQYVAHRPQFPAFALAAALLWSLAAAGLLLLKPLRRFP